MTASRPKAVSERVAALRERRAALGLVRLELYARPKHHDRVKRYAARLEAEREKSQQPARKD